MADLHSVLGILKSLIIYYGIPFRNARMKAFYGRFIRPGSLCFDIGAHVGNRIRAWSALGARIVAAEPQPACRRVLAALYGGRSNVTLVPQAVGSRSGTRLLHICKDSPTLSTLSTEWIDTVGRTRIFRGVEWETDVPVDVTTLDELIRSFGEPDFVKIDVEGFEPEVLSGLSRPLRCLSFEYLPADRDSAVSCVRRLGELGRYEYNLSRVETMRMSWPDWRTERDVIGVLSQLPRDGRSGDVYARLVSTDRGWTDREGHERTME